MDEFVNPFRGQVAPPPPVQRPRVRRFREQSVVGIVVLCTLLVVAMPIGFVTARPLYASFRYWRAERLAQTAEALAAEKKWEAALTKASAAYLLAPANARNSRLVAGIFSHFGSERALDFWQLAVAAEPGRMEDRRALIESALQYQQFELAANNVAELLRLAPTDRTNLLLAARAKRAARDYAEELKLLQQARDLWPNDPEITFAYNRVQVSVGSEEQMQEALAALRLDAGRRDEVGLQALDFFLTRPTSDFPDRERLAYLLRKHPLGTGARQVHAFAVEVEAHPDSRPERLDRMVEALQSADTETKLMAADWLLRLHEYARVIKLLPWSAARESPGLTLLHLDALSRQGDTAALSAALATPGLPLRKEFVHLCRWQAARASKTGSASDRDALAALESATSYPASLSFLASHFEEAARPDLAVQAFTRLHHIQKFRAVAVTGLLRLARRAQDTKGILRLLEQAKSEGLADVAAQGEVAYYQLLLRRNVRENRVLATRLATQHPDRITFFSTLALACLLENDPQGALKAFDDCGFNWRRAPSAMRAVYAAALEAGGRGAEAREVVRELPPESLLPEERALLAAVPEWDAGNNRREL